MEPAEHPLALRTKITESNSRSQITVLKTRGVSKLTDKAKAVCAALGLNADAAIKGKLVNAEPPPESNGDPDSLAALAARFEGTNMERMVRDILTNLPLSRRK